MCAIINEIRSPLKANPSLLSSTSPPPPQMPQHAYNNTNSLFSQTPTDKNYKFAPSTSPSIAAEPAILRCRSEVRSLVGITPILEIGGASRRKQLGTVSRRVTRARCCWGVTGSLIRGATARRNVLQERWKEGQEWAQEGQIRVNAESVGA